MALGIWAGVSGLGVALGPFVGGAVVEGIAWQWIFWLNVPIGLVLLPLAARRLTESHGPAEQARPARASALAGAGLFGLTFGIVRATALGWTSATVLVSIGGGVALRRRVRRAGSCARPAPMLPMRFFRSRGFAASNGVSFAMFFGVFGAIFLLSQFFQTAQGYGPFEAGLRTLPWTGDADDRRADRRAAERPDRLAAADGRRPRAAGDRDGLAGRRLRRPTSPTRASIAPFIIAGTGMALVFAPSANAVLSARAPAGGRPGVRRDERDPRARRRHGRRGAGVGVQRATARTPRRRRSATASWRRCRSAAVVLAVGAVLALLVPGHAGRARGRRGRAPACAEPAAA